MNNTTNPNNQQIIYVAQGKSRVVYVLLGLFFGGVGFHDFYAGYMGKGMLKILVTLFGACSFFVGTVGAFAMMAGETDPAVEGIALVPLLGIALLGLQALYVLYQLCTVTKDSKGIPFC